MKPLRNEQDEWSRDKLHAAIAGTQAATYRLQYWKARAKAAAPSAVVEHMPFAGHRNCAQWIVPE